MASHGTRRGTVFTLLIGRLPNPVARGCGDWFVRCYAWCWGAPRTVVWIAGGLQGSQAPRCANLGCRGGLRRVVITRLARLLRSPRLPPIPKNFPAGMTLALTRQEAEFLRDQVLYSVPSTLLAFLVDGLRT